MPIDARIPLMGRPAQFNSPAKTIGDAMQMRSLINQTSDDAAIRRALQEHPDDPEAAMQALHQGGHGVAGFTLGEHLYKARDARLNSHTNEMKMMSAAIGLQMHMLGFIHDQASFDVVRGIAKALAPQGQNGQPSPGDMMGTTYDPERIKSLMESLIPYKQKMDAAHQVRQDASQAMQADAAKVRANALQGRYGTLNAKDQATTARAWQSFAAHELAVRGKDNDSWQATLKHLGTEGVPTSIIQGMPSVFSTDAVAQVEKMQLTAKEREELQHAAKNAASRAADAAAHTKDANTRAANAGANKPLTPAELRARYNLDKQAWEKAHPTKGLVIDPKTGKASLAEQHPGAPFMSFDQWMAQRETAGASGGPAAAGIVSKKPLTLKSGKTINVGETVTLSDGTTGTYDGTDKDGNPIFTPSHAPEPQPQDEGAAAGDEGGGGGGDQDETGGADETASDYAESGATPEEAAASAPEAESPPEPEPDPNEEEDT